MNIYIDFSSAISIPGIELAGIIIENSKFCFFGFGKKLIVGSFTADSSINSFTSVNIKYTESFPGSTLNIDSNSIYSISANDNGAIFTNDDKTITFTYTDEIETKRFKIFNSDLRICKCEIYFQCSENSKLIQFSLTNLNTLYFLEIWPETAVIKVISKNIQSSTIISNLTVLPISLSGEKCFRYEL